MRQFEALYEKGLLRPTEPLPLRPGERVNLIVVRRADPKRWNVARLCESNTPEEIALTEAGLSEGASQLFQSLRCKRSAAATKHKSADYAERPTDAQSRRDDRE